MREKTRPETRIETQRRPVVLPLRGAEVLVAVRGPSPGEGGREKTRQEMRRRPTVRPLDGAEVLVAVRGPSPGEGGGKKKDRRFDELSVRAELLCCEPVLSPVDGAVCNPAMMALTALITNSSISTKSLTMPF